MSEWDEERMANILGRVGKSADVFNYVPSGNRALDDLMFVLQAANAEHKTVNDLRALLAQREGELEALRGIRDLAQAAIEATDAAMRHPITESKVRASMNATAALRAALSDNQESPALTDKEA